MTWPTLEINTNDLHTGMTCSAVLGITCVPSMPGNPRGPIAPTFPYKIYLYTVYNNFDICC